jgi:hypothetical protein
MQVVSRESAEKQIAKLFDYYEIDLVKRLKSDNADKAQAVADDIRDILITNVEKGRLEIDDDEDGSGIKIVQHLRRPAGEVNEIRYYEVTGKARTAIKDVDKGSPHQKIYALLAAISKQPIQVFFNLGGVDLSCAETLSSVFSLV